MVAHEFNPNTWEAETDGSLGVPGPKLQSKTVSKTNNIGAHKRQTTGGDTLL